MSTSSLRGIFASSVLIAGAVFSTLTLPLVVAGSETVVIQLKDEQLFAGKLKDVSAPYVGLVTALSLGVGIVNFSVLGWKRSSKKSNKVVEQLSDLQQQLKEKEALVEEVLVSESRLQAAGLDIFLDELEIQQEVSEPSSAVVQNRVAQNNGSIDRTLETSTNRQIQSIVHSQNIQAVNLSSRFTQALSGPSHAGVSTNGLNGKMTNSVSKVASNAAVHQVQQLQEQLKQLSEQVEQLQDSLEEEPQSTIEQLSQPELTNILLHQLNHRLSKLESNWSPQEMVS